MFASISGAVIAAGLVEVESGNQVVEHIDGGTVSEILVRDGDRVTQGDVLLRFSDGEMRSDEAILEAQFAELAAMAKPAGGGVPECGGPSSGTKSF